MTEERLKAMKGKVHIRAWQKQSDGSEKLIKDTTFDNLVVNVGKDSILRTLGDLTCGGTAGAIGIGDSTQAAALGDTDMVAASNKYWKPILAADKTYVRPTLFLTTDFGFSQANFTWNELGVCDDQGSPTSSPADGSGLWARQIDASPLVKDVSKRAIVEWQLTL
jgi:hypothetical protein|tara:strand:+ start:1027 stop:1521 length:495 start_codon:yes stop_codon:yes gene_type:complete